MNSKIMIGRNTLMLILEVFSEIRTVKAPINYEFQFQLDRFLDYNLHIAINNNASPLTFSFFVKACLVIRKRRIIKFCLLLSIKKTDFPIIQ